MENHTKQTHGLVNYKANTHSDQEIENFQIFQKPSHVSPSSFQK